MHSVKTFAFAWNKATSLEKHIGVQNRFWVVGNTLYTFWSTKAHSKSKPGIADKVTFNFAVIENFTYSKALKIQHKVCAESNK